MLTLGLVLDGSGFVRRSRVLAGNAVEYRTLAGMLADVHAPPGALVVMDRGIAATEDNLIWLRQHRTRIQIFSMTYEINMTSYAFVCATVQHH